ncbi:hypothetical protein ACFYPA_00660 [Streptomyces sp. NPDC005775]
MAATTGKPAPTAELLGLSGDFSRQAGLGDPGFLALVSARERA